MTSNEVIALRSKCKIYKDESKVTWQIKLYTSFHLIYLQETAVPYTVHIIKTPTNIGRCIIYGLMGSKVRRLAMMTMMTPGRQ